MASVPITSWQIDGATMKTMRDFNFLGSKITAGGDCSHEVKRHWLLGKKSMANLDSILKSRDVSLWTTVCLVKAMIFPVVMYGCESWTIKKVECQKIDAPRRSVLGVHWKDWCWSWNSSTLATWCKELTHLKRPWCWERLKVGGEGDNRGWNGWMAAPTWCTWVECALGVGDGQGGLACCSPWSLSESDTTERLDWTELSLCYK